MERTTFSIKVHPDKRYKPVIVEGVLGEGLTASETWDPNEELFQLTVSMSSFSSSGSQEVGIKF